MLSRAWLIWLRASVGRAVRIQPMTLDVGFEARLCVEIARLLGLREATVKSRLFRARERLRVLLAPYWNGGES